MGTTSLVNQRAIGIASRKFHEIRGYLVWIYAEDFARIRQLMAVDGGKAE